MATLGKTDIGGTFSNFANAGASVCLHTLTDVARLSKITIYFKGTDALHNGGSARGVIYEVESGTNLPTTLLAMTNIVTVPDGVDGWLDFPFVSPVDLLPRTYYLGIVNEVRMIGAMDVAGTNKLSSSATTVAAPLNPFGASTNSTNQKSCYATYEILPTFGKTTVGGTFANFPTPLAESVSRFTLTEAASVFRMVIYFRGLDANHTGGTAQAVIYASSAGLPGALVGQSDILSVVDNLNDWQIFEFTTPVALAAADYYLGIVAVNRCVGALDTAGTNYFIDHATYNPPTVGPLNPFGTGTSSTTQKSVYAIYTTTTGVTSSATASATGLGAANGTGMAISVTTFGKTTIGATFSNFPDDNGKSVCRQTLPANGNISKLTIYFKGTNISHAGGNAQGVIYAVGGSGTPAALLAQSVLTTVPDGVDGWIDFPFSPAVSLIAGDYYLGIVCKTKLIGAMDAAGSNYYNSQTTYNPPTVGPVDPFGTASSSVNQKSCYATYTAGAFITAATGSAAGLGAATGRAPVRATASAGGEATATGAGTSIVNVGLSFVGAAAAAAATVTIPAHLAGDLLIGFAYRATSAIIPTVPTGWTIVQGGTNAETSAVLAWRVAAAPGTSFGTWTNGELVAVKVYRGSDASATPPIGAFDMDTGLSADMTYAALSLVRTNNTSWVGGFGGINFPTSNIDAVIPTGMVFRCEEARGIGKIAGFDTDDPVNIWTLKTATVNASENWRTITYELLATTGGLPPVDLGLQYARPIADISLDNWAPSQGTQLAPMLDETAPVDSDYIQSVAAPTSDTAIIQLSPLTTPLITSPYTIRVRAKLVTPGTTIHVPSGGDIQAAINGAAAGSTITLAPGGTYTSISMLTINKPLTLTTAGWSFNGRVSLAQKPQMGQYTNTIDNGAIRVITGNATDVTIRGVYFAAAKNDTILLGDGSSAQTSVDQCPTRSVIDQCILEGLNDTCRRGIATNSARTDIYRCYIFNIVCPGTDSTGIGGWNGPGPFNIIDNFIEAASEGILFGGADPSILGQIPADFLIENNTFAKNPAWRALASSHGKKNHIEFKMGRRIIVRNNMIGELWDSAQRYSIVLTPTQYGKNPGSIIEDVLIERNVVGPTCGGLNLLGHTQQQNFTTQKTRDITFRDNWFIINSQTQGPQGWLHMMGNGPENITWEYNTIEVIGGNQWVQGNSNASWGVNHGYPTGNVFRRNIVSSYGVYFSSLNYGDATAVPPVATTDWKDGQHYFHYFPGGICTENVFVGTKNGTIAPRMPGNTWMTAAQATGLIVNGYGTGAMAGYGRRP